MCLLVLAWNAHPRYRLVIAANRDEYHDRPAAPLGRWPARADVLAGRDLRAGGTWLGIDRHRRFGVVTNFRDLVRAPSAAPSRGGLIPGYLQGAAAPGEYLAALEAEMLEAAEKLEFESAAALRDKIMELRSGREGGARRPAPSPQADGTRARARASTKRQCCATE